MVTACMIWWAMSLSGVFCGAVLGSTILPPSCGLPPQPQSIAFLRQTRVSLCVRILAQVHSSLSVLCMALTEYLVKGVLSRYCRFLNKGVGVESSEKLMKELSDPSPRLGPNPKNNLNSNTSERNGQSRILYHHPSNLLASLLFYISELISQLHNTTTTTNYKTSNI